MQTQDVIELAGISATSAALLYTAALATGAAVTLPAVAVFAVSSTVAAIAASIFTKYALDWCEIDDDLILFAFEPSLGAFQTVNAVAVGTFFGLSALPIGLMAASGFVGVHVYVIGLSLLS